MEEGFIQVRGKNIWYGVFEKEKSGIPLLVVHGGPGFCSVIESGSGLAEDRPVYFYDQLGSLRSEKADRIEDYTVDYFVSELAEVIQSLGLTEVILLGVSWGAGLVTKYLLDKKPEGVRALILNSPFLSARIFEADVRRNLQRLPEALRQTLERLDREGNYGDEYQAAIMEYYKVYVIRARPMPAVANQMLMTANYEVYGKLWGPSELKLSGELQSFDLMPELGRLEVPVLLVGGDNDEITVEAMREYQLAIPDARLAIIPDTGHLNAIEKPELFNAIVNEFTQKF